MDDANRPGAAAYKSKIDGSIQPYWINVPKDYEFVTVDLMKATKHRLDFWWARPQ